MYTVVWPAIVSVHFMYTDKSGRVSATLMVVKAEDHLTTGRCRRNAFCLLASINRPTDDYGDVPPAKNRAARCSPK